MKPTELGYALLLGIFLFVMDGAVAATTKARRTSWWSKRKLPTLGEGFVIPLSTDDKGRYTVSIGMGNRGIAGAPVQNFSFVLSTSSPNTAVAGNRCESCVSQIGSSSLYNTTTSQTDVDLNTGTRRIVMGDGSLAGPMISETCGFLTQNGSFWWYPNQTILMAENATGVFGNGAAGLLGLGRSSGKDSFFSAVFSEHQAWQNVTLSIALNNPNSSENPGNAGQIDLRETDPDLYEGNIVYQSVVASAGDVPVNYPADWSLHLDSWIVDTGGVRTEHTTGGVAIVEPYFPEIRFPQDQALLFYRDVPGAQQLNETSGLIWSLPCQPRVSLDVKFSGTPFSVPSEQLVTTDASGNCIGVVQGWDNPFVQSYMLGQAFAKTVYIVYNAQRNGTDSIGFAPRPGMGSLSDSKMSAGAVAGISVASTVAFIAILILIFLWWRHKRAVKVGSKPVKDIDGKHRIEPFTPTSANTTAMFGMNSPSGTVAGDGSHNGTGGRRNYIIEQGPIGGEAGQSTGLLSSMSPESTPQTATTNMAHRRKAEEAGFLVTGAAGAGVLRATNGSARPTSGQTHGTTTDFIQHLPGGSVAGSSSAGDTRRDSEPAIGSSEGLLSRHVSTATVPAGHHQQQPSTSTVDQRHVSLAPTALLSPTTPGTQIHYHIHLPPGQTAETAGMNFPPGSIVHQYHPTIDEQDDDEPAPEYTERERPRSVALRSATNNATTNDPRSLPQPPSS
ncbi:acid protease [Serendipita vermifera]|nr:acid protease [Serendipita vermifera]